MKIWLVSFILHISLSVFSQKIGGVNLESPQKKNTTDYVVSTKRIATNWIAIIPFAFMESHKTDIEYNEGKNWWGSTPEGIANTVRLAKLHDQKTFLKPHFWVDNKGWAGELAFSGKKWTTWEENYTEFILQMAKMADSLQIDMFCIGVEFKSSVTFRPKFWMALIPKIRAVYRGKLTYSANWDNYQSVPFWNLLDYIGIDAYFPLSSQTNPDKLTLLKKWEKYEKSLTKYAQSKQKQILFTEIGYRSIDKGAGNQWETENLADMVSVNLALQEKAFASFFETFWKKSWFAGAFIWEWHPFDSSAGGLYHSNYTPQHKPVEKIIEKWYSSK